MCSRHLGPAGKPAARSPTSSTGRLNTRIHRKVQSEAFRSAHLKFQDGPGICFERLEQELESETQESRAEAHLSIGKRDIQEYLEGRYPRKPLAKKQHRLSSRITGTRPIIPY